MLRNFPSWIKKAGSEQYPLPLLAVLCIVLGGILLFFIFPGKELTVPELVAEIVKSGRISRCAQVEGIVIDGVDYGVVCKNDVAYRLAFKRLDAAYCKALDDALLSIEQCEADVLREAVQRGGALALCGAGDVSAAARASCEAVFWSREAVAKKDKTLCENIKTGIADRDGCEIRFEVERAAANPAAAQCTMLSGSLAEDCALLVRAAREKDAARCTAIENERFKRACAEFFSDR